MQAKVTYVQTLLQYHKEDNNKRVLDGRQSMYFRDDEKISYICGFGLDYK